MSKQARALLKANGVTIYMLEQDKNTLNPVSAYDPPYTKQILATKINIDNSLTGQAIKAKTAKIFNNNEKAKGAFHLKGTPISDKDNIIVSPLKIDDIIIGALTLVREGFPFTEKELIIVNTFATYASTAIKNANIHRQLLSEIDDKEKTQILLKNSHDRYESIFDGATDGIIYTDWNGKIISVNPTAVKLLGVTQNKMIGGTAIEIAKNNLSGESLARMLEFIKKALKGDAVSDFLIRTAKGEFEFNTTYGKGKPGLTVMIRDVTERNKAREKINLHQRNLQSLTSELAMAEEKARRRLAITLHDKLGQSLVLAKFKTNELTKQTTDSNQMKVISEITSFIEDAIKESRSITYELSPPVLYEMGLTSAISWKLDEIEKSNILKTSLIDQSRSYELEKREEIILYRTINELLQNTIKHAKAKNVVVTFRLLKDNYRIIVSDNGIGFDLKTMREKAVSQKKFGLFSVIERIGYIGGEVNIDTAPDKGTKVIIDLPIKN
jgi:PAS domain S-box-containing protein